MLYNIELYRALKEAGVSHESAEAAAVVLAKIEHRLLMSDVTWRALRFYGAFAGIGLVIGLAFNFCHL
jgi:hypothetical protein